MIQDRGIGGFSLEAQPCPNDPTRMQCPPGAFCLVDPCAVGAPDLVHDMGPDSIRPPGPNWPLILGVGLAVLLGAKLLGGGR